VGKKLDKATLAVQAKIKRWEQRTRDARNQNNKHLETESETVTLVLYEVLELLLEIESD
jgi:hypothetical protein